MNRHERRSGRSRKKQYWRDFYKSVADAVAEGRRQVLRVCPTVGADGEDAVGFSYTIGNAAQRLPELLIIGRWGSVAGAVLHQLSDILIEQGQAFAHGSTINIGGKFPVMILDAGDQARSKYTIQAGQFLGDEGYAVQQVVAPDLNGRFPDDPLCLPGAKVPLLNQHTH